MKPEAAPGILLPRCAVAFFIGLILLGALSHMTGAAILDDAYIFARYADNLLQEGIVAWNPGGPPTYGTTSLLYLALVLPFRFLIPGTPALAMGISSATAGIVLLALLALMMRAGSGSIRDGIVGRLLVFGSLAVAVESFSVHFGTGMDTTFAAAFLASYILVVLWHETRGGLDSAILTGLWGSLAFAVRPDLLLFTVGLPLCHAAVAPDRRLRRGGIAILVSILAGLAVQTVCCSHFLHSPLPLSFFAKGMRLYGDFLHAQYRLVGIDQLLSFLSAFWFLWVIVGVDFALQLRDRRRPDATETGLLVSLLLFAIYYGFFVTQIMPYQQRFFHPALPALLFVAARALLRLAGRLPDDVRGAICDSPAIRSIGIAILIGTLFPSAVTVARSFGSRHVRGELFDYDLIDNYQRRGSGYWYRLEAISSLPDDLTLATTEVGLPAAMNPCKAIVDLTGLNETRLAQEGFSADYMLAEYAPDFIYMPHPHYARMTEILISNPGFSRYEYIPAADLGTEMGVALKKGSRHYESMRKIASGVAFP